MTVTYPFKGRAATTVIAASNSNATDKAQADIICTGSSDQTVINQAITNLPTYGGKIKLLAGLYSISGSIVIDRSYVDLEGESHAFWGGYNGHGWQDTAHPVGAEGTNGAKIKASATGFNLLTINETNIPDGGESRHRAIRIASLYFYGNSYNSTAIAGGANDDRCILEDLFIHNVNNGIDVWMDTPVIRNNNIQDIAGDAVTLKGTKGHICENLIWDIGGKDIVVKSPCDGTLIENNNLSSPASNSIYLNNVTNCTVVGNTFNNASGVCILTDNGSGHVISGNNIYAANVNMTTGIQIGNSTATPNCVVSGNQINQTSSVTGYAIDSHVGSAGCSFDGNVISGGGWNSASTAEVWRLPAGAAIGTGNAGLGSTDILDPRIILGANLVGMYDPTDKRSLYTDLAATTNVAANNDKVAIWKDLSRNAYNLSSINASSPDWRPTWKSADVNSKPYIFFNGGQFMQNADGGSWAGHPGVLWGSMGVKLTGGTGTVLVGYPFNSAWGSPFADWMLYENTGTSLQLRTGATNNNVTGWSDISATSSVVSWGNDTGKMYQNNVLIGTTASTARVTYTNNTGISIGAHNASGSLGEQVTGYYGGLVIANAEPTIAQQTSINKWIAAKGGISTSGF